MESDGRFMIIIIMRERPRRMYLGGQAEKETPWCFVHWGHRGPSTHTESASLRAHSPRAHHYWRMYNFFMSGVLCACVICVHNEPIYCRILMGWNMNWLKYGWRGTVLCIGEFECPMCLAFTNRREKFAAVKSVVSQFLADDVFSFKLVVINVKDFFALFSVKELSTFFSRPSEMRLWIFSCKKILKIAMLPILLLIGEREIPCEE